jgi:hypothetical protein
MTRVLSVVQANHCPAELIERKDVSANLAILRFRVAKRMSNRYWRALGFIKTKSKKKSSLALMPSVNDLVLCYERAIFTVVPGAFFGRHKEILPLLPTKKQLLTSYQPGTLPAKRARRKAQTQQSCCQVSNCSFITSSGHFA